MNAELKNNELLKALNNLDVVFKINGDNVILDKNVINALIDIPTNKQYLYLLDVIKIKTTYTYKNRKRDITYSININDWNEFKQFMNSSL